jgi:hypothetical protein
MGEAAHAPMQEELNKCKAGFIMLGRFKGSMCEVELRRILSLSLHEPARVGAQRASPVEGH